MPSARLPLRENMDPNASQSPGPDSSRRRSGRVVKVPEKFVPDVAHPAAKRKRGLDQDGDDRENEAPLDSDDEMSDAPSEDDEPTDDHDSDHSVAASRRRAATKKTAKSGRTRKPANKRVKT